MTKENMETVRTLVNEIFKIKEANQGMYISMDINMHSKDEASVSVGAIGDSGKCFVTGSLGLEEFEIPVILDTIKGVVVSARTMTKEKIKKARIAELQQELEELNKEE